MTVGYVAGTIPFSVVDGPGNRFAVFLQGCNFDCIACHNPQTIPHAESLGGHSHFARTVDDLLIDIRRAAPFLSGVTVSGGEATQQAAFVYELFAAIRNDPDLHRLTCFMDSNGACTIDTWNSLVPVMDGAMIDLKCLDDGIHRSMTGQSNEVVLTSIRYLHERGVLHEVRLLLLAGINDDPDLLRRTASWLAEIDSVMRVKVIGFRRHGARPRDPALREPTPEAVQAAADLIGSVAGFDVSAV